MASTHPSGSSLRRYGESLAAGLAAALAAGLGVAATDLVITASRADQGVGLELVVIVLGLYLVPAVVVGLGLGVLLGAVRASFGDRALDRLRGDRALDRQVTGALAAGAIAALLFALVVSRAALVLVAGVERKATGALLLGLVCAAMVPVIAAFAVPIYRVTRRIAGVVPRIGPMPAAVVAVLAAGLGGALLAVWFVFTRLDWRALDLAPFALAALFPALLVGWVALAHGPLSRVRERIPRRGAIAGGAAVIAVIVAVVGTRGRPGADTAVALTEHSGAARVLVALARSLSDGDGDGFSAFLGGPDCDDANAAVNPAAREIPGNGLDDNCVGGDRAPAATPEPDDGDGSGDPTAAGAKPAAPAFAGNVLFLFIDTVRADRLGVAGYQRDGRSLTPRIDALAGSGTYFTRAWAQAPNTPRSTPSILFSRFPSQVATEKASRNYPRLEDDNVSLFEVLREGGWHTEGYASHFYFVEKRNIAQGFEKFDNEGALDIKGSNKDIASPRIVPKVLASLAEHGEKGDKFAMFVHLFEPHSTYVEHEEFPITERGIPGLVQKYDYEIAYVDIWVGKILDALAEHGLADNTMVILCSDHGEAFGVHRVAGQKMFFHGQTLYDELLRVPLIIRLPDTEPARPGVPVMLLDIAPTVAHALGLERPESWVGRSLLPAIRPDPVAGGDAALPPRPVYGELLPAPSWQHDAKMMVSADGANKLIYRISDRRWERYDLAADPEERSDLFGEDEQLDDQLKQEMLRWMEVDLQ